MSKILQLIAGTDRFQKEGTLLTILAGLSSLLSLMSASCQCNQLQGDVGRTKSSIYMCCFAIGEECSWLRPRPAIDCSEKPAHPDASEETLIPSPGISPFRRARRSTLT